MDGDEDMGTGMTLRSGTMTGAHAVPQPQQEASAVPVLTTPEQKYDCFVRAIGAALGSWDALQTAVHQGWGGDDGEAIGRWMPGVVAELFQKPQVFHDELEDFLCDIMHQEFHTELEPGVANFVARQILQFKTVCENGGSQALFTYITKYEQSKSSRRVQDVQLEDGVWGSAYQIGGVQEDPAEAVGLTDAMDGMAVGGAEEPAGPIVDEDGFELLQPKGKGRRK